MSAGPGSLFERGQGLPDGPGGHGRNVHGFSKRQQQSIAEGLCFVAAETRYTNDDGLLGYGGS